MPPTTRKHETVSPSKEGAQPLLKKLKATNSDELEDEGHTSRSDAPRAAQPDPPVPAPLSNHPVNEGENDGSKSGPVSESNNKDSINDEEEDNLDGWGEDFDGDEDEEEDDEDARDYGVEEHQHVVHGETDQILKFRLSVCKEYGEEFGEWLENIHVRCTHGEKIIANAVARYIRRGPIRRSFWTEMEQPSRELADFAFELFDRYGYLKTRYKSHDFQKGTGAWGGELDYGPLLLIERIRIGDRAFRRRGVGKMMMKLLVDKAAEMSKPKPMTDIQMLVSDMFKGPEGLAAHSSLHVAVAPGWLMSDVEEDAKGKSPAEQTMIFHEAHDIAVAFYRSIGFRRIGASSFLGYSLDRSHTSHGLVSTSDFDHPEASSDYDSPDDEEDDESPFEASEKVSKKLERMKRNLPLLYGATALADSNCVGYFKDFSGPDESSWAQVDRRHNNVLHVLATHCKLMSITWIMAHHNPSDKLSLARNLDGWTPVEVLEEKLEVTRTQKHRGMRTVDISNKFTGFNNNAVKCLVFLKGLGGSNLKAIQSQRLKFGCTCDQCLDGFMSPRMKAALKFQAEVVGDMLCMEFGMGSDWLTSHCLVYLKPDVKQNLGTNKSYRQGFANTFKHIASCLEANLIPHPENIVRRILDGTAPSEWPPHTKNYLQRTGEADGIEAVLRICFDHAEDQDEKAGDGEYVRTMMEKATSLPTCRNDHEFGFVRLACGLVPRERPQDGCEFL